MKFLYKKYNEFYFLDNRNMFNINKPEFSLVAGDVLTYRCDVHQLIYNDLQIIYNDGLFTYERNRLDRGWRRKDTGQIKKIDIDWNSPKRYFFQSPSMILFLVFEVKIFEV
jgi:hypothetical protein